jgi:DNA-binding CsgD family transcriptional regulator
MARFGAARITAAEAVELARDTGQRTYLAWALVNLAHVEAPLGLEEECRRHLAESQAIAAEMDIGSILTHGFSVAGLLELGLENLGAAASALDACDRLVERLVALNPVMVQWQPDHVEALALAGRTEDAEVALAKLEQRVERSGSGWGAACVARCRGMLAPNDEIDEWFELALARHDERSSAFDRARSELCFGERLQAAGRAAEAQRRLEAAAAAHDSLGAAPWAERARAGLRTLGAPVAGARPAEGLTPKEHQVATLVAQGMSNREVAEALFVTEKTVEAHLGRVYRKLGLKRRGQLAGALPTAA